MCHYCSPERSMLSSAIGVSLLSLPASLQGMWDRTVIIGSAGKTFSATGWKVNIPCGTSLCPLPVPLPLRSSRDTAATLSFEPEGLKVPEVLH